METLLSTQNKTDFTKELLESHSCNSIEFMRELKSVNHSRYVQSLPEFSTSIIMFLGKQRSLSFLQILLSEESRFEHCTSKTRIISSPCTVEHSWEPDKQPRAIPNSILSPRYACNWTEEGFQVVRLLGFIIIPQEICKQSILKITFLGVGPLNLQLHLWEKQTFVLAQLQPNFPYGSSIVQT